MLIGSSASEGLNFNVKFLNLQYIILILVCCLCRNYLLLNKDFRLTSIAQYPVTMKYTVGVIGEIASFFID